MSLKALFNVDIYFLLKNELYQLGSFVETHSS